MSKLGFDKAIRGFERAKRKFLEDSIKEARKEFKQNFDSESSAENGEMWHMVKRPVPPKILVETGSLQNEATRAGRLVFGADKVVLYIDPIDERTGRGYAQYHQDGIGVDQREYVTHSSSLENRQLDLLDKMVNSLL